jgi:hypothetical protein
MVNKESIFSRSLQLPLTLGLILLILIASPAAESRTPRFPEINLVRGRTAAGHPYLSGGVSFEEQRLMEHAATPYNLRLIFVSRRGTLVSPNLVMIGANIDRHVEKISPSAPWLYVQLPPGGYTILARFKRQVVLVRDVYLKEGQHRTYLLRGD